MPTTHETWSKNREIEFLKALGDFSSDKRVDKLGRLDALKGYLSAAMKRDDWGGLTEDEADEVVLYCRSLISIEKRG